MNQLVEKFSNFSFARSYWEGKGKFILSITSKYGMDARTATPCVILGCLCLWIYVSKRWPPPKPKPKATSPELLTSPELPPSPELTRSWSIAKIHGGDPVLTRLRENFNKAQVNPETLANTENILKALLEEEHLDLMKLQDTVAKLEMSGREGSAAKMLAQAKEKAYEGNKSAQAHEIEMLLVEMLIYKGDLDSALQCKCLEDESIKDARRPLYKAIIHKMLASKDAEKNAKKAEDFWKEFVEVQDPSYKKDSKTNFGDFEEIVDRLQKAIKMFA